VRDYNLVFSVIPMPLSEFELIQKYFKRARGNGIVLGVGDDAAIIDCPTGMQQVITVDTLVEGTHFSIDADPESLGHKTLAVNLSDLAAMGATPAWITLALTLPAVDEDWLQAFSQGLLGLAQRWNVSLIGGDTTRGPLSITLQAGGWVKAGQALRRDGAGKGDLIYVTGCLGDAGLALMVEQQEYRPDPGYGDYLAQRLHRPEPRVNEGLALSGIASAAIDISDGLIADLGHILSASVMGATIHSDRIPHSAALQSYIDSTGDVTLAMLAGEDYELCVTVPESTQAEFEQRLPNACWIGVVEADAGLRCVDAQGDKIEYSRGGYDHFCETQ